MSSLRHAVRSRARHVALDGLSLGRRVTGRDADALARPRVHFPYLHAVPPPEEPAFRRLLDALAESHTFVSYDEAVRMVQEGPIDRPYVALSFDDGFESNVRLSRILDEYGAPGCFFVPTGFIGSALTPADARAFYGFSEGIEERAMTWAELEDMRSRGHAIENHTVNHPVLSQVSAQQATDEIHLAAEELRRRFGSCRHFAWPRGRFPHFTPAAARAVFDAGHVSCASAERGAHPEVHAGAPRDLCLRRDHEMTDWPLRHALYFMSRSSQRASAADNEWPEDWDVSR